MNDGRDERLNECLNALRRLLAAHCAFVRGEQWESHAERRAAEREARRVLSKNEGRP